MKKSMQRDSQIRLLKIPLTLFFILYLAGIARGGYYYYEDDSTRAALLHDTAGIIVKVNGNVVDDPNTPEQDRFRGHQFWNKGREGGQTGAFVFGALNYFRFSHAGSWGSHYQVTPLFTDFDGVPRQSSDCKAETFEIFTGNNAKNGVYDFKVTRNYTHNQTGELLAIGESYVSFINMDRIEDGKRYVDFFHDFTFTAQQDISLAPIIQGISAMYASESVQDIQGVRWEGRNGDIYNWDIAEEQWFSYKNSGTKRFEIGSWYEMYTQGDTWWNASCTEWHIELLEASGRANNDIILVMRNTGELWKDVENLHLELQFGNESVIDLKAGESFTVSFYVTTQVAADDRELIYSHGFEDSTDHWEFSSGSEIDPAGASKVEYRRREAEGKAAAKIGANASAELQHEIDISSASMLRLSFWFTTYNFTSSDTILVEYFDGSNWSVVEELLAEYPVTHEGYNDNEMVRHNDIFIRSGEQVFSKNSRFRFTLKGGSTGAYFYLDDIQLYGKMENSAPIAMEDIIIVSSLTGEAISCNPLANDSDPEGGNLMITAVGNPSSSNNTISVSGNSVTYKPTTEFLGEDTIPYTVSDGVTSSESNIIAKVVPFNNGSNVYEAEHADKVTGGSRETTHVKNYNKAGDIVEWKIWVPEKTEYVLQFYYKLGSDTGSLELKIDGIVQDSFFEFVAGGWGTWLHSDHVTELSSGFHTVSLTTNGTSKSYVVQLDKLVIDAPVDWDGTEISQSMSTAPIGIKPIVINTEDFLFIKGLENFTEAVQVTVYALNGRIVQKKTFSQERLKNLCIDKLDLAVGIHIISIESLTGKEITPGIPVITY